MQDFVRSLGVPFLPHILRRVSDELVRGNSEWNLENGLTAPPRTASTLLLLDHLGPLGITDIARELRQSHQLVVTWIRQLRSLGLIEVAEDPTDRRRTISSLTAEGGRQVKLLEHALAVEERALRDLMNEAGASIYEAMWRLEEACRRKPYEERLKEHSLATGVEGADLVSAS